VEAGYQFRNSTFKHTLDSVEGTTVNYSEKLSYNEIPVSLKYCYPIKSISPYIEAGATFSFLSQALSTTTRDDQKDLINRTDYRNTNKVGWFGGIGVGYKFSGVEVFAGARYTKFSKNLNKEGTRYTDLVNVFKYYYIDDDFKLDNLQVNIGASLILAYKNKKIK
jgi:opacity protein-like surface antigen